MEIGQGFLFGRVRICRGIGAVLMIAQQEILFSF